MAIQNNVSVTATMLARIGTLEQMGLSEHEQYEFFVARWEEQQALVESGKLENPEVQQELIHEYKECSRFVHQCIRRNEMLRMQNLNAAQYASETNALTVGELMNMLNTLQQKWSEEDVEFLGELKDMPLCVGSGKGITKSNFKLMAEHGLVAFDSPRIAL